MTGNDPLLLTLDPLPVLTSIALGDSIDLYLAMNRRDPERTSD
ncbi:hypothetical protein RWH43_16870 [Microbacterium sp. KSW2-21]|uniref:Uncharacterized protein n=1 Tax=Microbacterium algihabitans TaxID=3075992 RepID=A0ABU3RZY2_9MICO|nr:hypothetical protein [Microbacterium sp. KSW2-21]MDU0328434.1 hypothetical protein [Microbacterium sp. KSW2-21]